MKQLELLAAVEPAVNSGAAATASTESADDEASSDELPYTPRDYSKVWDVDVGF